MAKNRDIFKMLPMFGELPYVVKTGNTRKLFYGTYVTSRERKGTLIHFMAHNTHDMSIPSYLTFWHINVYPVVKSIKELTIEDVKKLSTFNPSLLERIGPDRYLKREIKLWSNQYRHDYLHVSFGDMQILASLKYDIFNFINRKIGFNYSGIQQELNGNGIYL